MKGLANRVAQDQTAPRSSLNRVYTFARANCPNIWAQHSEVHLNVVICGKYINLNKITKI